MKYAILCFFLISYVFAQDENAIQPLWSMPNWATVKYSDELLTRVSREGIQVYDLSNGDLLNTINIEDLNYFEIINDVLFLRTETEESRTLTGIDLLTSEVKWHKSFDVLDWDEYPKFFLAKDLIIVDTIIERSYQHQLNAYDVSTGVLVWTQLEKELNYLREVSVEDDVIIGTGGRHTSTSSTYSERNLYTGELIQVGSCGLICSSNPSKMVFEDKSTRLIANYSLHALTGFSRFDLLTEEVNGCSLFGESGYTHEDGSAFSDDDLDKNMLPFQVKLRQAEVLSDGNSIVLILGGKVYQYPMCAEEYANLLEVGGLILDFDSFRWSILELSNRGFLLFKADSNKIVELSFEAVKMDYQHPEYDLKSQYPFSIRPIHKFAKDTYYRIEEDYVYSFDNDVFEFTDLISGESLAKFQVDTAIMSSENSQEFQKYDVAGDYLIVYTTGGLSVFQKPTGFDF